MQTINFGKRKIGKNKPCYIIAEIGSNFDMSLEKAKKMIKLAKKSGADCAKFQSFLTEELLAKNEFKEKSTFQKKWKKSVWSVYKNAEFPRKWHKELADFAKKNNIDFMSTPYDFEAVDLLEDIGVKAYKIGSGDITIHKFLEYVANKKKPVILPTGASNLQEIKNAVNVIKKINKKIILLQSVTQYPSKIEDANVLTMVDFHKKFGFNVGYSDHSLGIAVPIASVAHGACVIEKHFTDNQKNEGPDHPHSLNPEQFFQMVKLIRDVEKCLGINVKEVQKSEKHTRIIQRRSVYSIKEIKKGELFSDENIKCLRPANGLSADKFAQIINKKAKRTIKSYSLIKKTDF